MKIGLAHRQALRKLSPELEDEFDRLTATLQQWSKNVTTGALTADSITVGGYAQGVDQLVVSAADFTTASGTLANITGLSVNLVLGGHYLFEALIHAPTPNIVSLALGGTANNSSTAGDPNISYLIEFVDTTNDVLIAHGSDGSYGLGVTHSSPGGGNVVVRWSGWLIVGSAGTLTIQVASGGGTVTVRRGSWLRATRLP